MRRTSLHWMADPYSKDVRLILAQLEPETVSSGVAVPYRTAQGLEVSSRYQHPQGLGAVEYWYTIEGEKERVEALCRAVSKVSLRLLVFSFLGDLTLEMLQGVLSLLPAMIETLLPLSVSSVSVHRYSDPPSLEFLPQTIPPWPEEIDLLKIYRRDLPYPSATLLEQGRFEPVDFGDRRTTPIYVSEEKMADLFAEIRLEDIVGYRLWSRTPLIWDSFSAWAAEYEYNPELLRPYLKTWHDLVLIPQTKLFTDRNSIFEDWNHRALVQEEEGAFALPSLATSLELPLEDQDLWTEIAFSFGFSVGLSDFSPHHFYFTSSLYDLDTQEWLVEAARSVHQGQPPQVLLDGPWPLVLPLTEESLLKVRYAALRGWGEEIVRNPLLAPWIEHVKVSPDFSISVPVFSSEEVVRIQTRVANLLRDPTRLRILACKDLEEGVVIRWKTQQEHPSSQPLLLITEEEGDRIPRVVSDSPLVKPSTYEPLLASFREALGDRCGDMNLPDQLRGQSLASLIARWEENACGVSERPEIRESPALEGIYDLGPIRGIVSQPPKESSFDITEGDVQAVSEDRGRWIAWASWKEYVWDLVSIPAEGENVEAFRSLVSSLWKQGWFFTPWAKHLWKTKQLFSSHLLRNITAEEGIFTWDRLKQLVEKQQEEKESPEEYQGENV